MEVENDIIFGFEQSEDETLFNIYILLTECKEAARSLLCKDRANEEYLLYG